MSLSGEEGKVNTSESYFNQPSDGKAVTIQNQNIQQKMGVKTI